MFGKSKFSSSGIEYIIVGLGNPGKQYENTRHNAGFMAIDRLAEKENCKINKIRFKSTTGECTINGHRCLLMKPSTFMNLSGQAVVEAMNFYKIPIEKVIVIHDDVTLAPGRLRIRQKGSDGGHNGLKNIIYLSGKNTFPRVKIGVGDKPHPDYDMADWVLGVPNADDRKLIEEAILKINDAIELIVKGDLNEAMNRYNRA